MKDIADYLRFPAEVTIKVGYKRQWWRPWRFVEERMVVWHGYIVNYTDDYARGASITLSDTSGGYSRQDAAKTKLGTVSEASQLRKGKP